MYYDDPYDAIGAAQHSAPSLSSFITPAYDILSGITTPGASYGMYASNPELAIQSQKAKGSQIGKGIGTAAGAFLGPAGMAVGGLLGGLAGGLFGKGAAEKKADRITDHRSGRKRVMDNFMSDRYDILTASTPSNKRASYSSSIINY